VVDDGNAGSARTLCKGEHGKAHVRKIDLFIQAGIDRAPQIREVVMHEVEQGDEADPPLLLDIRQLLGVMLALIQSHSIIIEGDGPYLIRGTSPEAIRPV